MSEWVTNNWITLVPLVLVILTSAWSSPDLTDNQNNKD